MKWYRARLNGQNFLLSIDNRLRRFGFYTTRDVKANSFEDAEQKAVELIKNDKTLINNTFNERADSPMIYIEEIRTLEPGEKRLKNSGYTFYSEDNETS